MSKYLGYKAVTGGTNHLKFYKRLLSNLLVFSKLEKNLLLFPIFTTGTQKI